MVHALQKTHSLLNPTGKLVVVHDLPQAPWLTVYNNGQAVRIEQILDRSGFELIRHADGALGQVVDEGFFALEQSHTYTYEIQADSLEGYEEWAGTQWDTVSIPESTTVFIIELLSEPEQRGLVEISRPARIITLNKLEKGND